MTPDDERSVSDLRAKAEHVVAAFDDFIGKTATGTALEAAIDFARLWLADHPADDAKPITSEWLVEVGFKPGRFPTDLVNGPIVRGIVCNPTHPADGTWMWLVRTYKIPADAEPKTRGDLRRLCQQLGLTLKEPTP